MLASWGKPAWARGIYVASLGLGELQRAFRLDGLLEGKRPQLMDPRGFAVLCCVLAAWFVGERQGFPPCCGGLLGSVVM